ncbi:hypothetical protein PGQ11_001784 [Apiospora arundinis]|uniref:DUF7907 domain-containing protein n=1 Tax=Apiospora arundinis TaxID=335852 RepID=A0ABR2JG45_9PEZI
MQSTLLLSIGLLGLSSAIPLESRGGAPVIGQSTGFQLSINVTDPRHALYDRVNGNIFTGQRLSQGVYMGIVRPRDANSGNANPFYFTASPRSNDPPANPATTTYMRTDVTNLYPMSAVVGERASEGEHHVALQTAQDGTPGLFYAQGADNIPVLAGPGAGTYVVCPRTIGAIDLLLVNYVYAGEAVPADCAPGTFVLLCAALPETEWSREAKTVACVKQ